MREIIADTFGRLDLGRQGENEALKVKFSIANYEETYGAGTFAVINKRCCDIGGYPCAVEVVNGFAEWIITAAETACAGEGDAQLVYTVGDTIARTLRYKTYVSPSVGESGGIPQAGEGFLEEVLQAADRAEAAAEEAEAAASSVVLYGEAEGEASFAFDAAKAPMIKAKFYGKSVVSGNQINSNNGIYSLNAGTGGQVDLGTIILRSLDTVADEYEAETGKHIRRVGSINMGAQNFTYSSADGGYFQLAKTYIGAKAAANCKALSAIYTQGSAQQIVNMTWYQTASNFRFRNAAYTDVNAFRQAMQDVEFIFELASETETAITAQHLETKNGNNALAFPTSPANGKVELTYWRDSTIPDYIAKELAGA